MLVIMLWFPSDAPYPLLLVQIQMIADRYGFSLQPNPSITFGVDGSRATRCQVVLVLAATTGGHVTNIMEPRVISMIRTMTDEVQDALLRTLAIIE